MNKELPRVTKRELAKVGIALSHEDNVRDWMRRGWCELELYLWKNARFMRIFEEDGA